MTWSPPAGVEYDADAVGCLFLLFVAVTCVATAGLAVPVWLLLIWLHSKLTYREPWDPRNNAAVLRQCQTRDPRLAGRQKGLGAQPMAEVEPAEPPRVKKRPLGDIAKRPGTVAGRCVCGPGDTRPTAPWNGPRWIICRACGGPLRRPDPGEPRRAVSTTDALFISSWLEHTDPMGIWPDTILTQLASAGVDFFEDSDHMQYEGRLVDTGSGTAEWLVATAASRGWALTIEPGASMRDRWVLGYRVSDVLADLLLPAAQPSRSSDPSTRHARNVALLRASGF